ncbi:peptidyl-tRNA hydrolase [Mycobacteroides abscessus subsp. abscessus]|nr:peptidyl-tRNA hydrolase [Mycobacteroides abscessus subsp. abscessus]
MPVLSDDAVLVVGLGNPGPNYAKTRHNLGFMVADLLAAKDGATFKPHKKSGAEATTIRLGGRAVNLAKPRTFMNTSGPQVAALAKFFSVPPANVIVMHDELDLDFGTVRLKLGGGEGGHNGLRSVSQSLGTKDYLRVRLGVGRPPGRKDPAAFVLENFAKAETDQVPLLCEQGADAAELLIRLGLEAAQNQVHAWGQDANTLEIEAEALSIPEGLTVSVEGLEAGTQITAGSIELPKGVTLISDPETLVVNVVTAPTAADLESEGAGEEGAEAPAADEAAEGSTEE